jgi:hypothetical protein
MQLEAVGLLTPLSGKSGVDVTFNDGQLLLFLPSGRVINNCTVWANNGDAISRA